MSARVRLTLWYVAALCLGLALFAGAILWQTTQAASAALDAGLDQRAHDVVGDLQVTGALVLRQDAPDESARRLGEATLWIRVLDGHGRVVVQQGPPLPGVPARLLATTQPGMYQQEVRGDLPVHLVVRAIMRGQQRVATVQILTTVVQIETARRQLLAAMGVAGGLIVLCATLGGLFLAERTLRPVGRITDVAARIGAGALHQRVADEVHGPGNRAGDDELGRLVQTFDAMLARLEEADDRRRRLTADAAHELGTPIATIAASAEIALRHPRAAAAYQAVLDQILAESRHMARLIDDLLLLARSDAGTLPLSWEIVEIDEVCRQAVRAVQPLAEERSVALCTLLPPQATLVRGDEGRLGQVVRNLLDNALRYTPSGGTVTLNLESAGPAREAGGRVIVRVQDTGPGIVPHERDRVFERFHRAPVGQDAGRAIGGNGLGLAICKAIVVAHGGQIRVEGDARGSERGGTQIVVVLPVLEDVDSVVRS